MALDIPIGSRQTLTCLAMRLHYLRKCLSTSYNPSTYSLSSYRYNFKISIVCIKHAMLQVALLVQHL